MLPRSGPKLAQNSIFEGSDPIVLSLSLGKFIKLIPPLIPPPTLGGRGGRVGGWVVGGCMGAWGEIACVPSDRKWQGSSQRSLSSVQLFGRSNETDGTRKLALI